MVARDIEIVCSRLDGKHISSRDIQIVSLGKQANPNGVSELFTKEFVNSDKKIALIIGVEDYAESGSGISRDIMPVLGEKIRILVPNLNVKSDINMVEKALLNIGYQPGLIQTGLNLTKKQILELIRNVPRDASLFLFLAGHGLQSAEGAGAFLPKDAILKTLPKRDITASDFDNTIYGPELNETAPPKTCLIADMCHAEAFVRDVSPLVGIYSSKYEQQSQEIDAAIHRDIQVVARKLASATTEEKGGAFTNFFFKEIENSPIDTCLEKTNNSLFKLFGTKQEAGITMGSLDNISKKIVENNEKSKKMRIQLIESCKTDLSRIETLAIAIKNTLNNLFQEWPQDEQTFNTFYAQQQKAVQNTIVTPLRKTKELAEILRRNLNWLKELSAYFETEADIKTHFYIRTMLYKRREISEMLKIQITTIESFIALIRPIDEMFNTISQNQGMIFAKIQEAKTKLQSAGASIEQMLTGYSVNSEKLLEKMTEYFELFTTYNMKVEALFSNIRKTFLAYQT